MPSRTPLSIALGLTCGALAVGGLYWAGGRDAAPDPSLDRSADARAAYRTGREAVADPRLRIPAPAPADAPEAVAAAGAQPSRAADDVDPDGDRGDARLERDDDHGEHGDDRGEHDDDEDEAWEDD